MSVFRSGFSEDIFNNKYSHYDAETWEKLAWAVVNDVCGQYLSKEICAQLVEYIKAMKFIPGGRYLYYAARGAHYWNNCYLFQSQTDTRQDWAMTSWKFESALMTGGGCGNDYSVYRHKNALLNSTGGVASGPLSKAVMINEIGRHVMQGGSRRAAMYASIDAEHVDAFRWILAKDWDNMAVAGTELSVGDLKRASFEYHAPMDMTNMSLNFGDTWLNHPYRDQLKTFTDVVEQMMKTGEPGFSFNFLAQALEVLRNACGEVCSADDNDVCNLASVNMSRIESITEFQDVCYLGTLFLLCGTFGADLPFQAIKDTREKNRRLGLGLMGIHEWLLGRGHGYEVVPELHLWLTQYRGESDRAARDGAAMFSCSHPIARRSIAPTGTIGLVAGTTTGIEPVFAVAYKRHYLEGKRRWKYQYVVDSTAELMINQYGLHPDDIETAMSLAGDYEKRIKFQADVQDYVDQCISSTINLPAWGSPNNNPDKVSEMASMISKYAPRLRGFTAYPDGARGGQPLIPVQYTDAMASRGHVYEVNDVCEITGGGTCGE